MLMKKCVVVQKNRESRRQRQSGAAENRPAGLTPRRCGVSLTPAWFEATSLNVNGSPDVPDISVGFVAAAVSMPMGGCRARRPVVDVSVAAELAVL